MNTISLILLAAILTSAFINQASAEDMNRQNATDNAKMGLPASTAPLTLAQMKHRWAEVNYQLVDEQQEHAFQSLLKHAELGVKQQPESAANWVMLGIIQSTFAKSIGGLSALPLLKKARTSYEQGMKLDDNVMEGSAYGGLGILYLKIPGWPISFGDEDKAKELLDTALTIDATSIDSNFFMAEYYLEQRNYLKAKHHLISAQQGRFRQDWALADELRQAEIKQLLIKVNKKI